MFSPDRTTLLRAALLIALSQSTIAASGPLQCAVIDGCSSSRASVVQRAIQQYDPGLQYGGDTNSTFSLVIAGGGAASIGYGGKAGSSAPVVDGLAIQKAAQQIATCPGQCGTYTLSDGFGVTILNTVVSRGDSGQLSNRIPIGQCCTSVPTNDEILAAVESLSNAMESLRDIARQWLQAIQDTSSSGTKAKYKRSLSSAVQFHSSLLDNLVTFRGEAAVVDEEIELAAREGSQVAADNVDRVQTIVRDAATIQSAAEGAAALDAAAVVGILGTATGFGALALLFGAIVADFSSSTTPPSGTPSVCDICEAFNAAAARATPVVGEMVKRSPWDSDLFPDNAEILPRSLVKRAGRVFTSGTIGSYGISFANEQAPLHLCPDNVFVWNAQTYPSTRGASGQQQAAIGGEENTNDGVDDSNANNGYSAPDLQGIGRIGEGPFVDIQWEYTTAPITGSPADIKICGGHVYGFNDRYGSTNDWQYQAATGNQPQQHDFDTEHVFELHMIKDWFYWMVQNDYLDCGALSNIFGSGGAPNAASRVMEQLSWYDPTTGQGYPSELFVVNRGLNHLKGAFMHGRPLTELESTSPVLPRPSLPSGRTFAWNECIDYLRSAQAVFQYLDSPGPRQAFINTCNRITAYLSNEAEFPEFNEAPQGFTWVQLFNMWLNAWLTKRQQDVTLWRDELRNTCRAVADDCWMENYDDLFSSNFPEGGFTYPGEWYPAA